MLMQLIASLGLVVTPISGETGWSGGVAPGLGGPCLGEASTAMKLLLQGVQRVLTTEVERGDEVRAALDLTRGVPEDVRPVTSDSTCARALRILREQLGEASATSDVLALVSVQGRFVAYYRFRAAKLPVMVASKFYFDREFTRVVTAVGS